MNAIHGRKLGKLIADALGIDISRARSLRLNCKLDDAATLEVEYIVKLEDVTAFADEFKKFRPIDETEWKLFRLDDDGGVA